MSDPYYIEVERVIRETEKALLVKVDPEDTETLEKLEAASSDSDYDEQWIPKSQIHDDSEVHETGDSGTLAIKRWLAEQMDLL